MTASSPSKWGGGVFRAKTLLVIGAGASFEVGLPVGHNLLASIAEMTHFQFEWNRLIIRFLMLSRSF